MTISEDTPEGGPDELQWKIDRLIEQVERHTAELERERRSHSETLRQRNEARDRFDDLTSRLTVGVLRKAGYVVLIKPPEVCDTCGEEY
jgi:hypothetical protein